MENTLALSNGTLLGGDYRIERVLGAGGFGITYLAQEVPLDRPVAIKEYFPSDFATRDSTLKVCCKSENFATDYKWGLERFIDEAQALARFDHTNIVRVYRYFRANNTAYMALKFEDGRNFKSWLESLRRPPTQGELDAIVKPLLSALETIHAKDFLHRDIAPDNIIIRPDGSPVLIDFGSARGDIAQHTKTVSALVKPGYSPFEQYALTGKQQGPWTDIYALAATLYHGLTGKRPHDAPTRLAGDELTPVVKAARGSYRPSFLAAIDRALALRIENRPVSVPAWRERLFAASASRKPQPTNQPGRAQHANHPNPGQHPRQTPPPKPAPGALPRTRKIESEDPPPLRWRPKPKETVVHVKPTIRTRPAKVACTAEARGKAVPPGAGAKAAGPAGGHAAPAPAGAVARASPGAPNRGQRLMSLLDQVRGLATTTLFMRRTPSGDQPEGAPKAKGGPARPSQHIRQLWPRIAKVNQKLREVWPFSFRPALPADKPRPAPAPAGQAMARAAPAGVAARADAPAAAAGDGQAVAPGRRAHARIGRRSAKKALSWESAGKFGRGLVFKFAIGVVLATAAVYAHAWWPIVNTLSKVEPADGLAPVRTIRAHNDGITSIALSADAQVLVSAGRDGFVNLWDLRTGELSRGMQIRNAGVNDIDLVQNYLLVARSDGRLAIWSLRNGRRISQMLRHRGAALVAKFARNGRRIYSGGEDNRVVISSLRGRVRRTLRGHSAAVISLAYSDGNAYLASGSRDRTVRLWSTRRRRLIRTYHGHGDSVSALALSNDGLLLASGSDDKTVRIWSTASPTLIKKLDAHAGPVTALAFSPDGKWLASAGEDNTVKLWDVSTGNLVSTYQGHTKAVRDIAFFPTGRRLVSAGDDGTIRVWRTQSVLVQVAR